MNLGTIRRAALAALILAVVASGGCSGDGLTAPRQLRISDVGRRVAVHELEDGAFIKEYEYDGVTFLGDMLVSEYEFALGVAEPLYEPGEVLLRVINFRAYPRSMSMDIFRPADGFGLMTCTSDGGTYCSGGMEYIFEPTMDGFGLARTLWWVT